MMAVYQNIMPMIANMADGGNIQLILVYPVPESSSVRT
jgi:hypothetical protein